MSIDPRWRIMLALASIWAASCTKRNPDLCCNNNAECTAIGFSSFEPCDLGVCVQNACTTEPNVCDDDRDCPAATNHCVNGTCAACATDDNCPVSAPVCDTTAQSCRGCAKDSECDSLACDLAAGTCVEPARVLYAGPAGTTADPCTRSVPCSFQHAAELASESQPYIALLSGIHSGNASFSQIKAIIAGNGQTLTSEGNTDRIYISDNSDITLRDVVLTSKDTNEGGEDPDAIIVDTSSLTIDGMIADTRRIGAVKTASQKMGTITVRNSRFEGESINVVGVLNVDSSFFTPLGPIVTGKLTMSNSVIVAATAELNTVIHTAIGFFTYLQGNTFINGKVICDGSNSHIFQDNIFYNVSRIDHSTHCQYSRNLIFPLIDVGDTTTISTDPLFINPSKNDYHLRVGSPAIDAGSDATSGGHDFDGTPRPQGLHTDLGAFEFHPTSP